MIEPLFLLDSNICIYVLRDSSGPASRRLRECREGSAVTSTIAYAEVMRGLPPGDVGRGLADALFQAVPVLPFDEAAARRYADIPFKRGTFDRLIAAHCLALGLTLVTNNETDFEDVPDLRIENWTRRQRIRE